VTVNVFRSSQPFSHVILDCLGALGGQAQRDLEEVGAAWPADDWPHWVRYDAPEQRKRTCHLWPHLPAAAARVLGELLQIDQAMRSFFPHFPDLRADPLLWGAGMHSMGPGEHVGLHLDADRHRWTGWTRRANVLLFCEPWQADWGGELELWSSDGRDGHLLVSRIRPRYGRLVFFDASGHHRVNQVCCPANVRRKSLSVYFWGPPSIPPPGKRPRAEFVA